MKKLIFFLSWILISVISCNKNDGIESRWEIFNNFPKNKYYSHDIMPEKYMDCYGLWDVYGTSGGFSAGGYSKDFDQLILKKNGIFGIVRNDSLIAYGKMILDDESTNKPICKFVFDEKANIQLFYDNEKYLQLKGLDSLNLTAPCCDRFHIHLKRKI